MVEIAGPNLTEKKENSVHALQRLVYAAMGAEKESFARFNHAHHLPSRWQNVLALPMPSRASSLHLIQWLAKTGPIAIGVILTLSVWMACTNITTTPVQTTIWMGLIFLASAKLFVRNRAFLAGDAQEAARPFHWRACHTANLSVLGTAFGAGVFMLSPIGAQTDIGQGADVFVTIASLAVAGFVAALFQIAHGRAALAILFPVLMFSTVKLVMIEVTPVIMIVAAGMGVLMFGAIGCGVYVLTVRARKCHPRTVYEPMTKNVARVSFRRKSLPTVARANEVEQQRAQA